MKDTSYKLVYRRSTVKQKLLDGTCLCPRLLSRARGKRVPITSVYEGYSDEDWLLLSLTYQNIAQVICRGQQRSAKRHKANIEEPDSSKLLAIKELAKSRESEVADLELSLELLEAERAAYLRKLEQVNRDLIQCDHFVSDLISWQTYRLNGAPLRHGCRHLQVLMRI